MPYKYEVGVQGGKLTRYFCAPVSWNNGEYPNFCRCIGHNRIPNRSTEIRTLLQIAECEQPLAHSNYFQKIIEGISVNNARR